jgi:phosphatidylserine/phosphatidylglycerophosphate/cardiolipin synthase-like enzyme
VQAYSFTSAPIAKALVEAHQRGVRVEVLLDKSRKGNLKGLNDC